MDFFTTEYITLSDGRAEALRHVGQLVSQRLSPPRESALHNTRALLDTVGQLRDASSEATPGSWCRRSRNYVSADTGGAVAPGLHP